MIRFFIMRRWSCLCLALAVFCLGCMAPAWAADTATVLSGKAITTVTRAVPFPFNAVVDEVLVAPGDAVVAGQALVRYHLQEEAERVLQREVTLGAGTEELRTQVLSMERTLAEVSAQRNKTRQLVSSKLGSAQALRRLEDDVSSLQQRIALNRAAIERQEATFQARLKELSGYYGTDIGDRRDLPKTLVLTAPVAGRVLSVSSQLHADSLQAEGAALITIGQMDPMLIQVQVYEADLHRIKEGDSATVEIPSLGNKKFTGHVTKIAWESDNMDVSKPSYYAVELSVPNPDMDLRPGFKAIVYFK